MFIYQIIEPRQGKILSEAGRFSWRFSSRLARKKIFRGTIPSVFADAIRRWFARQAFTVLDLRQSLMKKKAIEMKVGVLELVARTR